MPQPSGREFGASEQIRLAFAGGIIASWFAYLQVHAEVALWIGQAAYRYGLLTISVSAALSFLFLLSVAAQVKFLRKGKLEDISLSQVDKIAFYDLSVDVFELIPWIVLFGWLHGIFGSLQVSEMVAWLWAIAASTSLWAVCLLVIKLFTRVWVRVQSSRMSESTLGLVHSRVGMGLLFFVLGGLVALIVR